MQRAKSITRKDILFISILAGMSFIVENSLGLVLAPLASAVPLIGGTLSAIPDALLVFLGAFLVPRRGSILLFATILLTLSTVTPSFGPPGAYKILIGVSLGLLFEAFLLVSRHTLIYIVATAVVFAASIPVTYMAWLFFGLPGLTALASKIPLLMAIYLAEGLFGAYLGWLLYAIRLSKISRIVAIRQS